MKNIFMRFGKFIKEYLKYVVLTLIFAIIVLIAFILMCKNINEHIIVTINSAIISIFGGALASVVVAWLIDIANHKTEAIRNKKMIDCVLCDYDIHVKIEMERCLSICAKQYDIDINKSYNIEQIKLMLDELDESNLVFDVLCETFSKMIDKLESISVLFFEKSDKGMNLFRQLERIRGYAKVAEFIKEKDNDKNFTKFIALQMIEITEEIDTIREDCNYYQLSENDKKYIASFREAKNKKEEQNASN